MSRARVDRQSDREPDGAPGEGGESVVHSLPIYVFRKDLEGRVIFANDAFCRMLDRSFEQLVGRTDSDHYPPEFASKYRKDDQWVIETGRTLDTVEEHRLPDGSQLHVRVIKTPLTDRDGATVGVQGVFWDVSDRVQSERAQQETRAKLERQNEQYTLDLAEANRALEAEIAERKRIERELRDSQAQYHSLVRHLPMAVFRKDQQGRITFVNEESARDLGTTPDGALGKTDFDFFREELALKYRADDEHVMKTDEVFRDVEEHDDAEGRRRFVQVMKAAVHDHAGRVIGTQGLYWDVTERREAELAVREGKQVLQAIIDNTSAVIYLKDLEGRYLLINHQFEQLFGIRLDAARGKRDYDLFPKVAADAFRHNDETVARTRQILEIEEEVPQGGKIHTYWSTKFPLFDDDGDVFAVGGISTDITHRKLAEEAIKQKGEELERINQTLQEEIARRGRIERELRDSEALYHSLVEHVPLTIFRKDTEGRFTFANSALCKEFDAPLDQIIGKTDADFSPPDLVEKYHRDDRYTIETGQVFRDVERFVDAEGNRRFIEVVKTPVHDHAGATVGMQGVFWDVTDRKRTEEALKEKSEQLEQSNQDLQQFAYVASHDLQEPLRMVSSYCQLLEKRYKGRLDKEADEFIHYAVDGAKRMQQLINDLLVFSRVESRAKPFEPSDLRHAVEVALANLRSSVEESGAEIRCGSLPEVMGDNSQLAQLFQNLIGNAIKFRRSDQVVVEVDATRQGGEWVICVRDNGIGIPHEQRDRIFELFRRLNSRAEYPGTGIGLAVCKKVVDRHRGRLWVESSVGEGSTFYFSLPTSQTESESPA